MLTDLTSTKIEFLKNIGTEKIPHSGDTLLSHLVGVYEILKNQGAEEYVQDAGLFHSIYGTSSFLH